MKSKHAKSTTVLVVEDEPTVRALAESIIEALGYMILSAANAREAIALLEQDEPIDILFTDINLPDGPDAIDELSRRRSANIEPSTLIFTNPRRVPAELAESGLSRLHGTTDSGSRARFGTSRSSRHLADLAKRRRRLTLRPDQGCG